jgi:hypothetical protein
VHHNGKAVGKRGNRYGLAVVPCGLHHPARVVGYGLKFLSGNFVRLLAQRRRLAAPLRGLGATTPSASIFFYFPKFSLRFPSKIPRYYLAQQFEVRPN